MFGHASRIGGVTPHRHGPQVLREGRRNGPQVAHVLREGRKVEVEGGIDFTDAVFDEDAGKMCILKEEEIDTLTKKPVMECTHK